MNVLIVNGYSGRNRGDQLILNSMIRLFQARGCAVRLIVDDPRDTNRYPVPTSGPLVATWPRAHGSRLALVARILRTLVWPPVADERFAWADVCVSAGGGYLYDDGTRASRLNLVLRLLTIRAAEAAGLPVVLFSQSIGPFTSRLWARLTARTIERAKLVLVREELSFERCTQLGVPDAVLCDDCAFVGPPGENGVDERARGRIGVTVLDRLSGPDPSARRYERYFTALADGLAAAVDNRNVEVLVISQVDVHARDSDHAAGPQLVAALRARGVVTRFIDLGDCDELELSAYYAGLRLLVASRLHSAILAMRRGTPAVGIGYLTKFEGVFDRLGMRDLVLHSESLDSGTLEQTVSRALNRHEALRLQLRDRLSELRANAERAVDLTLDAASSGRP
jgi:colanic acid/amylovoran biosynthesis protein